MHFSKYRQGLNYCATLSTFYYNLGGQWPRVRVCVHIAVRRRTRTVRHSIRVVSAATKHGTRRPHVWFLLHGISRLSCFDKHAKKYFLYIYSVKSAQELSVT